MTTLSRLLPIAFLALSALLAAATPARAQDQPATPAKPDAPAEAAPAGAALPPFTDADARVYLIELKGEFGRDVHINSLRQVMADAQKFQPDFIVVKIDTDFSALGEKKEDFDQDPGRAFNQLESARSLSLLFTDDIRDDAEWKTRKGEKPRVIMWVKRALGGVAFLPFVVPDIYFAPGAHHGGIGYLERIFAGTGDKVAQEKQYSLRLGRAEGLALKGGHDPRIIKAMARSEYVLSVSFVNGQPVFYEDESGDLLLTNDATTDEKKRDTMEDLLRNKGKNVLTLDAETAFKIGLSKGTVETIDDLATELGIARSFVLVPGKAPKLIERWSRDVAEAERNMNRLWREYRRVTASGDTPQARNKGRSQQVAKLREIKALLEKFSGAVNPRKLEGFPAQGDAIQRLIDGLQEEMRRDR